MQSDIPGMSKLSVPTQSACAFKECFVMEVRRIRFLLVCRDKSGKLLPLDLKENHRVLFLSFSLFLLPA